MADDISNIPTQGCSILNSATSIYNYNNGVRTSYTQVGGKWYEQTQSSYINIPTGVHCLTSSELTTLNSNAAFFPIFEIIAFALSFFVFWLVFRLCKPLLRLRV